MKEALGSPVNKVDHC